MSRQSSSRNDSFVLVPAEGINPMAPATRKTPPVQNHFPRIFVGGIPKEINAEQLVAWFHKYGLEIIEMPRVLTGKKFGYAPNVLLKSHSQYKRAIAMECIPMGEYLLDVRAHRSNSNSQMRNNMNRRSRPNTSSNSRNSDSLHMQNLKQAEKEKEKKEASMIEHHCRVLESKIQQLKVKEAEYILGKQRIEKKIEEYKIALHMQRLRQHQHAMKMQKKKKKEQQRKLLLKKAQAAQVEAHLRAQAAAAAAKKKKKHNKSIPMPTGDNVYEHVYGDILVSPKEPSMTPEQEKVDVYRRAEQQLIKQIRKMTYDSLVEKDPDFKDERSLSLKQLESDLKDTLSKVRERLSRTSLANGDMEMTNLNDSDTFESSPDDPRLESPDVKDAVLDSDTISVEDLRTLQKSFEMRDYTPNHTPSTGQLLMLVKDEDQEVLNESIATEDRLVLQPLEEEEAESIGSN